MSHTHNTQMVPETKPGHIDNKNELYNKWNNSNKEENKIMQRSTITDKDRERE